MPELPVDRPVPQSKTHILEIEYEACREGIARFDGLAFRIRQWNATATATLAAASFAATNETSPDELLWIAIAMNFVFWFFDAMQKGLQLNFIRRSRTLELILASHAIGNPIPYRGPEIGINFEVQHNRHLAVAIAAAFEQSLAPFYILPIAGCVIGIACW